MSDDATPVLNLPYILPNQAQKHVTHNEALRLLDVIVQLSVLARNLAAPPASPAQGDRYIIASGASGGWAGQAGKIALFDNAAWQFITPLAGWSAWVISEQVEATYSGTAWVSRADGILNFAQLGISTTPDAVNRLAVSSAGTLLNHAGDGHQLKINKSGTADTASLLFQTAFSGRAELGTIGNDDFAIKVSADGTAFAVGLSIQAASGQVTLPAALRFGGQANDPISPPNGTIWLNTTTGEVKLRSAGVTSVLAGGAQGLPDGVRGDVTLSSNGTIWTINAASVSNSKLAPMANATFKARRSAGTGAPEDISAADAAQLLPIFTNAANGLVPASGGGTSAFLRADGSWAAPGGGGGSGNILNAAATAPASPVAHMPWLDTSGGLQRLNLRNGANTAWVSFAQAAGYGNLGRNILINAALVAPFAINQRGFTGVWSSLADGAFGFDRWAKSGENIRQRIEAGCYKPSTLYTVSGMGIATSQVISPASGTWEVIFPNSATFLQIEEGSQATPFELRPLAHELLLCQRYFEMQLMTANSVVFGNQNYGVGGGNLTAHLTLPFAVRKRSAPTITVGGGWTLSNSHSLSVMGVSVDNFSLRIINGGSNGTFSASSTANSFIAAEAEI